MPSISKRLLILLFLFISTHSFLQENTMETGLSAEFHFSNLGQPGITPTLWFQKNNFRIGGGPRIRAIPNSSHGTSGILDFYCRKFIHSDHHKFKPNFSLAMEFYGAHSNYSYVYDTSHFSSPSINGNIPLTAEHNKTITDINNNLSISLNLQYGFQWDFTEPISLIMNFGGGIQSSAYKRKRYNSGNQLIQERKKRFKRVNLNYIFNIGLSFNLSKIIKTRSSTT